MNVDLHLDRDLEPERSHNFRVLSKDPLASDFPDRRVNKWNIYEKPSGEKATE